MSQHWCDLLFAHWPVHVSAIRPLVPERLEIDRFDGEAWIGVVPFRMEAVRPRFLPAVPWLSAFPELNVRTYVRLEDRPGVFFFSLDATNPIAVGLARSLFHLPYFRAKITAERTGGGLAYRSQRTHSGVPHARLEARYGPTGGVFHSKPGSLDHFLTERYCLYAGPASVGGSSESLYRGEVDHAPWPLQPADADFTINSLLDWVGLDAALEHPPRLLFARRLDVRVWPLSAV